MQKTYIIAEAGINHNGCVETAKKMIDASVEFGADAIKFQTFRAQELISSFAPKAEYQKNATDKAETQLEMISRYELNETQHEAIITYSVERGIQFLSTAFDISSIRLLESYNIPLFKIPSGEITNLPYLIEIAKLNKPVILSTGMSTMEEVKTAVDILNKNGAAEITVLHCNTEYPTPYEDVNLNAMLTIKNELRVKTGYSDHTLGIEIPIAAVAMGAEVIEKHFTLDRNMEGPDHKASLEPEEFAAMVRAIRNTEIALGSEVKKPSPSEMKNIVIARKSIIAKSAIKKGEIFAEENITAKRPGNGISPMKWFDILGLTAVRDFNQDEMIEI